MTSPRIRLATFTLTLLSLTNLKAQGKIKADSLDRMNLTTSKTVISLLENKNIQQAEKYFDLRNGKIKRETLEKLSAQIHTLSATTKKLFQTSYKGYLDKLNIDQVIYYNDEGTFFLAELFFTAGDSTSKIIDLFIKDPTILAKKRKERADFKRSNPNVPLPPPSLPPGIYIKENN